MRRREFIMALTGAAATTVWPFAVCAQIDRVRRIGVLVNSAENVLKSRLSLAHFVRVWSNWAGARVTTFSSIMAGPMVVLSA